MLKPGWSILSILDNSSLCSVKLLLLVSIKSCFWQDKVKTDLFIWTCYSSINILFQTTLDDRMTLCNSHLEKLVCKRNKRIKRFVIRLSWYIIFSSIRNIIIFNIINIIKDTGSSCDDDQLIKF